MKAGNFFKAAAVFTVITAVTSLSKANRSEAPKNNEAKKTFSAWLMPSERQTANRENSVLLTGSDSLKIYIRLGMAAFESKKYAEAIDYLTKALQIDPTIYQLYYRCGRAEHELGDIKNSMYRTSGGYNDSAIADACMYYNSAIEYFNKAIELNPKYAKPYSNRGIAKTDLGDLEGAKKDFDKAIKLNPKYYKAYCNRAYVQARQRNFAGAISDYSKAIQLNPNDAVTYCSRGIAYYWLDRPSLAIKDITKALSLVKDTENSTGFHKTLHKIRSELYYSIGEWGKADDDHRESRILDYARGLRMLDIWFDPYCFIRR